MKKHNHFDIIFGKTALQLVFQDVATPLTNMHYLGAQRGAMYSAEHNVERFYAEAVARNRSSTPVKNLYISGVENVTTSYSEYLSQTEKPLFKL